MMRANYYEYGSYTVVQITGRLEPDQNKPFRDVCEKILKDKEVIFCLDQMNFTASANIMTFFESIQLIPKAKVVGLSVDFLRLLELKGHLGSVKAYKTISDAMGSDRRSEFK